MARLGRCLSQADQRGGTPMMPAMVTLCLLRGTVYRFLPHGYKRLGGWYKESLNKPTHSLLFYYLPLISLFALRQRRCSSLKTSSRHSSSLRQSVSMDSPSGSRSGGGRFSSTPIPRARAKIWSTSDPSGKRACASMISANSKVRSAPSELVPTQGVLSSRKPGFLFSFFVVLRRFFFLLFLVAVAL